MSVDLAKPLELNDGTPLVLSGGDHSGPLFDVRTENGEPHPAFPIYRWHGTARINTGLVISNHKYSVRNRAENQVDRIDLSFRKGDRVISYGRYSSAIIVALNKKRGEAELSDGTNEKFARLRHTCHNDGAPFETVEHDHAKTYQDGYMSGLFFGMQGRMYSAGGPWDLELSHGRNSCRHFVEHDRIVKERNKNWKEGWAHGQAEASRRLKKHVDPNEPVQVRKPDGDTEPVTSFAATPAGFEVRIDNKNLRFKPNGVSTDRGERYILENAMPATLECRRFGIFGQTHTGLFDTLEEVSEHWWKTRDPSRGTKQLNGEFIVALRQERDNGQQPWRTVEISGPLEPLDIEWDYDKDGKRAKREGWQIDGHSGVRPVGTLDPKKVVRTVIEGARLEGDDGMFYRRAIRKIKNDLPEGYLRMLETYAEGNDA